MGKVMQWIQINVYPSKGGPRVVGFLKESYPDRPHSRTIKRVRHAPTVVDSLEDAVKVMDRIFQILSDDQILSH